VPATSVGLCPPGTPLQSRTSFRMPQPSCGWPKPPLQGLVPCKDIVSCRVLNQQEAMPLMGFFLPRGITLFAGNPFGADPLMSFFVVPLRIPRMLYRVLPTKRKDELLRVRPPLARFLTVQHPRNSRVVMLWVTPRSGRMLPSDRTPIRTSRPLPELPGIPFR